jgi:putative molybdopterin biosynthesis protein
LEESYLYHQIADSIRQAILTGSLKPGDRLPSVRQLCEQWNCTPGTIQHAYRELAREGLVVSQAGRGTQVAGVVPQAKAQAQNTLRRAALVNRAEIFLLEALTGGYQLDEIQRAMDMAMDRWRSLSAEPTAPASECLRFAGSHDMVVNELARFFFGKITAGVRLELVYLGSLGGLMALAEGKADLAGCHLWDAESDTYNWPFIQRLLPGKAVTVVTLAHRRIGLILSPGNPKQICSLAELTGSGIRFVNRQPGSGTRVWLDAQLAMLKVSYRQIDGYEDERLTHSDVARAVAEGQADVGLGLETAAAAYGLDFFYLNEEQYDLVMLQETARRPEVQDLIRWLQSDEGKQFIDRHPGYGSQSAGQVKTIMDNHG